MAPFSTAGMYSRGTTPPLVSSANWKPVPGGSGVEAQDDMAVLAATAGLTDELRLLLDRLLDRFLVRDLRPADVRVDLELAQQAVDDDLEVQLAHPLDDGLAGLGVGLDAEGRILGRQLLQRRAEALLVLLGLRLDGDRDHRLGELDRLEDDRMVLVAHGVAGGASRADPTAAAMSPA